MKLFPLKEFRFKTNPEIYMRIVGEYSEKRHVNIVHNFELVAVDVIYFVLKSLVQFQSEVDMWFLTKQNVNRIFVNDRWLLWCTYLLACDFFSCPNYTQKSAHFKQNFCPNMWRYIGCCKHCNEEVSLLASKHQMPCYFLYGSYLLLLQHWVSAGQ